jgi:hypothetical protein
MPLYMDVHHLGEPVSVDDVAKAHLADLEVQDKYDVKYLRYWVDEDRGEIFCLVEAPSPDAANIVHKEAHGLVADEVHLGLRHVVDVLVDGLAPLLRGVRAATSEGNQREPERGEPTDPSQAHDPRVVLPSDDGELEDCFLLPHALGVERVRGDLVVACDTPPRCPRVAEAAVDERLS